MKSNISSAAKCLITVVLYEIGTTEHKTDPCGAPKKTKQNI